MTQEDATAARLAALGAPDHGRLNLKLAGEPPPIIGEQWVRLEMTAAGRPILLATSTHPGEEAMALQAFAALGARAKPPFLVIAPRHPDRGAEVAAVAAAFGPAGRQGAGDTFGAAPIFVADALGELGAWFALADSALIGGSLLPGPGGHNPIEAAQIGAPMIAGPHVENWNEVYADLGDAVVRVDSAEALAAAWRADLDHPDAAMARTERARTIAERGAAGLSAAADALIGLLP
jgi:3-deoxy-D-manno-octulosonic-acid transferase